MPYAEGTESGMCGLEITERSGSLIGSVDPVTRRILAVIPFAPPVVEGGILPNPRCSVQDFCSGEVMTGMFQVKGNQSYLH